VEYYLNRCIYLSAYSKTTKFNKDKVRSVEIDYYREQVLSFDQWQHHEANIGSRLTTEQLDSLISQLPVFDAELVRLWSVDGFSYEDASRISGIPKEVMYQSIRKSIKLLREYVQHKNRSTGSLSGTA
jgi:DNA-directed RNA polymerase specialized sigma24 family protein